VKVNSILDVFGAIILLSAIAVVVRHPAIVGSIGTQFNSALKTATSGG
jgi:hypothetical protein